MQEVFMFQPFLYYARLYVILMLKKSDFRINC